MNKRQNSLIAVYAIIFVVFNILFYVIPFPKTPCTWIAYAFALLSIILGCGITLYAFKSDGDLRSKVYGFPVFRIGYIYLFAQLIISIVLFILSAFVDVPSWIALVLSIIALGLALIGVIATDNARDIIEEFEEKAENKTQKMTYFRLNIDNLFALCHDDEIKKKLDKLADKIKYSDPVSGPGLEEIEHKIEEEIKQVSQVLKTDNKELTIKKIDGLIALIQNRNNMCKALKGNSQ